MKNHSQKKNRKGKNSAGHASKPSYSANKGRGGGAHSHTASIGASAKEKPDLYGIHAVREAFLNPNRVVHALYLTPQSENLFADIIKEAQSLGLKRPNATIIEKSALDKALHQGAVHQGVALACEELDEVFLQDILIARKNEKNTLLLILDQVTDPHNVGAILRSASAFGAAGVIMQRKHAPPMTGVLVKTASGAADHIPVILETNLSRTIETLREEGYFVYGLDERGEQTPADIKKGGKTALVLGAEGSGLRRLVREHCDSLLKLPTTGEIRSLNVSNAAAVALYAMISH